MALYPLELPESKIYPWNCIFDVDLLPLRNGENFRPIGQPDFEISGGIDPPPDAIILVKSRYYWPIITWLTNAPTLIFGKFLCLCIPTIPEISQTKNCPCNSWGETSPVGHT